MIIWLSLSLAIAAWIGFWVLGLLWNTSEPLYSSLALRVCLGTGLGLGICSLLFFLWMLVISRATSHYITLEVIFAAALPFSLLLRRPISELPPQSTATAAIASPLTKVQQGAALIFLLSLVATTASFVLLGLHSPHGGWDAWSTWNIHARFLFRGGHAWKQAFKLINFNPDYPLLLPATIARCWTYVGRESQIAPVLIALVFELATVSLMVSSLAFLRSRTQGFLGGLILLGTPFFISHASAQYADVPIGFFFLATLVLFSLHERCGHSGLLVLAGLAAGCAIWTKNEGVFFWAALAIGHLAHARQDRWGTRTRELGWVVAGGVPFLLAIAYFKLSIAAGNAMVAGQGLLSTAQRLVVLSRYLRTGWTFFKAVFTPGFGNWAINLIPILAFYGLLVGSSRRHTPRSNAMPAIACVIMGLCYFMAFITTPFPLAWHLETSLTRLLLQLWPSAIYGFILFVNTPEQAVENKKERQQLPRFDSLAAAR